MLSGDRTSSLRPLLKWLAVILEPAIVCSDFCSVSYSAMFLFIFITFHVTDPSNNHSEENKKQQHSSSIWENKFVIHSSFALNVLLLVIIGESVIGFDPLQFLWSTAL